MYDFMNLQLTLNQAGQRWGRGLRAIDEAVVDAPSRFQSPLRSHLHKLPYNTADRLFAYVKC